jgi:transposase
MGPAVEPQLREAPVMNEGSWVGLDVHARSVVAGVIDAGSGEVRSLRVPPGPGETVAWLQTLPAPVRVVYEAGPTGYGLARACAWAGISCVVAAPSRIRAATDRVKTDRRDAERLARLLRLGEVTPVRVPGPDEEAARDLVRAREDARGDLVRLATGFRSCSCAMGRCTTRPRGRGRMLDAKTRRDALDKAITELAATPPYAEVVERLLCLRGVSTLTAFALTVELGDWSRFRPESLGPFLGLTPSEHSSGERRRQGAITKTGNSNARRLLIEAAWHQRRPPLRSVTLERRRDGKPLAVQAQAERSARRLHARWHALEARGKPRSIVVVAVARELAGHCWALATME